MDQEAPIFIIDDDVATVRLIEAVLQKLYLPSVSATDGTKIAPALHQSHFSLLIVDLLLPAPGPKGWEIIAYSKSRFPALPIIAITAAGPEVLQRGIQAGADVALHKPFSVTELSHYIRQLMVAI